MEDVRGRHEGVLGVPVHSFLGPRVAEYRGRLDYFRRLHPIRVIRNNVVHVEQLRRRHDLMLDRGVEDDGGRHHVGGHPLPGGEGGDLEPPLLEYVEFLLLHSLRALGVLVQVDDFWCFRFVRDLEGKWFRCKYL